MRILFVDLDNECLDVLFAYGSTRGPTGGCHINQHRYCRCHLIARFFLAGNTNRREAFWPENQRSANGCKAIIPVAEHVGISFFCPEKGMLRYLHARIAGFMAIS